MQSSSIARLFCALLAAGIGVAPAAAQAGAAPAGRRGARGRARRRRRSPPDARRRCKAALAGGELAELPADRARGDRRLLRGARLCARSGPSRAAHAADELVAALEASRRAGRCRAARYEPEALALLFDAPGDADAAARARGGGDAAPTCASRPTSRSGVARCRPAVNPEISRKPVARRRRRRCWPPLGAAPVPEALRRLRAGRSRLCPADRREGAARGAGAGRRPGGRRSPDGATLHPGETQPAGGGAARRGWRGSATSCRPARPRATASTTGWQQAVRALPARLRAERRRRGRARDARGGERAGRDAAGAGGGQPRAAALDERAISARAISSSTSPTSP